MAQITDVAAEDAEVRPPVRPSVLLLVPVGEGVEEGEMGGQGGDEVVDRRWRAHGRMVMIIDIESTRDMYNLPSCA